jgi:hypothetical protein
MERLDIRQMEHERPNLYMELQFRNVREAYRLNDTPTGPDSDRQGKKTWIIYAVGKANDYIIQSVKGSPDRFYTWIYYGEPMTETAEEDGKIHITIDKTKVGRKPRTLTDRERAEILARREKKETINQIAKAMHLGTKRVMGVLKNGKV